MLQKVLNECGQKLVERSYADFGAFVLANLHDGETLVGAMCFDKRRRNGSYSLHCRIIHKG